MSKKVKKCLQCCNCCRQTLIEIQEFDTWREPQLISQVNGVIGKNVLQLKMPCVFLHPDLELCTIYATRPSTCVAHVPGTNKCCPQYDPDDQEYLDTFTED